MWRTFHISLAGIGTVMVLSAILGLLLQGNSASPEVASPDWLAPGDIAVALASVARGELAFTKGVSVTLIRVIVAVAMFLMNLIYVNLAAVKTFLVQGIYLATRWEKDRATKATHIAIVDCGWHCWRH